MNLLAAMSTRGKIALAGSALVFVLVAYLLFNVASQPSYTTVAAGITTTQASKAITTLQAAGIGAKLINGGTGIAVLRGKEAEANVALAGQGLSGGTQQGIELNNLKLGASSLQQQVAYQGALEAQISGAIAQIDGVSGAQVQLTLPQNQLFASDQQAATAAVLLGGDSSALGAGAVKGIASLVAASVQGLKPANVTITDSTGALLWPNGGGGGDGSLSKPAAEASYDAQLSAQLMAMVTRAVGPNKAQVQVHADLNVDQAHSEQLIYGKKGVPMSTKTTNESLTSSGGGATGTAGTAANLPTFAQTAGTGTGKSAYKNKTAQTDLGVNKTITRTVVAPGAVNSMAVALVLDKSIPAAQATAIKNAVATAAGLQTPRDTITLSQVPFAKAPAAAAPAATSLLPPALAGPIKLIGAGFLAMLFLFFMSRAIKKRESDTLMEEPTWLKEIAAPRSLNALEASTGGGGVQMALPAPQRASTGQVTEVVASEPDRAAQQLKAWITEDQR
jgi:flagellar M-ring protein FliF